MKTIAEQILERLVIMDGIQQFRNLALIPIRIEGPRVPECVPLSIAIEKKWVRVREASLGGTVSTITVENHSDHAVFIMEGEELTGAKQNRTVNISMLIAPQSKIDIPVSCTEQGRWGYRYRHRRTPFDEPDIIPSSQRRRPSHHGEENRPENQKEDHSPVTDFHSPRHSVPLGLRKRITQSANKSYEERKRLRADQGEVWRAIRGYLDKFGVRSSSSALSDAFEQVPLEEYLKPFSPTAEQTGVMVFINGNMEGLEVFGNTDLFRHYFPMLLRGYAMEARRRDSQQEEAPSYSEKEFRGAADRFLGTMKNLDSQRAPSVGMGVSHRFNGAEMVGQALEVDDSILHASFFAMEDAKKKKEGEEELRWLRPPFTFFSNSLPF